MIFFLQFLYFLLSFFEQFKDQFDLKMCFDLNEIINLAEEGKFATYRFYNFI